MRPFADIEDGEAQRLVPAEGPQPVSAHPDRPPLFVFQDQSSGLTVADEVQDVAFVVAQVPVERREGGPAEAF